MIYLNFCAYVYIYSYIYTYLVYLSLPYITDITMLFHELPCYTDIGGRVSLQRCVLPVSISCMIMKSGEALAAKVREWDSNGTVFGFNPSIPGHDAGWTLW